MKSMATPNALFAVLNVSNPVALKKSMESIAPWVPLELQEGEWLLIAPGGTTTKEVSDRLGFANRDSKDTAIVLRAEGYFGRNYQNVWEWIATKQGAELAVATPA
jgi:hypothetical protein